MKHSNIKCLLCILKALLSRKDGIQRYQLLIKIYSDTKFIKDFWTWLGFRKILVHPFLAIIIFFQVENKFIEDFWTWLGFKKILVHPFSAIIIFLSSREYVVYLLTATGLFVLLYVVNFLSAICRWECGVSGKCKAPNLCECPDGSTAPSCGSEPGRFRYYPGNFNTIIGSSIVHVKLLYSYYVHVT